MTDGMRPASFRWNADDKGLIFAYLQRGSYDEEKNAHHAHAQTAVVVTAPEVGIILMIEAVCAPFFAFGFFGEIPPLASFIGGAVILVTILVYALSSTDHPHELFDLENDPHETRDLSAERAYKDVLARMVAELRRICDPEKVDMQAKEAQAGKVEEFGGRQALIEEGALVYTPRRGELPR